MFTTRPALRNISVDSDLPPTAFCKYCNAAAEMKRDALILKFGELLGFISLRLNFYIEVKRERLLYVHMMER